MDLSLPKDNSQAPLPQNFQNKKGRLLLLILTVAVILLLAGYFLLFSGSSQSEVDTNLLDEDLSENQSAALNSTVSEETAAAGSSGNSTSSTAPTSNISGVFVNNLFIPSSIDTQAVEFLLSLEGQGQLPIKLDENELGKPNPFTN